MGAIEGDRGRKGAKIRAVGGYTRVGGGLAMGGGKKNRSDVGEGGKRAVRGGAKGWRKKRVERGKQFRGNQDSGM